MIFLKINILEFFSCKYLYLPKWSSVSDNENTFPISDWRQDIRLPKGLDSYNQIFQRFMSRYLILDVFESWIFNWKKEYKMITQVHSEHQVEIAL